MLERVALNVSLTAELAAFVAAKVEPGRYSSASQVIRMSLRLLEEKAQPRPNCRTKCKARTAGTPDER